MGCFKASIIYPPNDGFELSDSDLDQVSSRTDTWKDGFSFVKATCVSRGGSGGVFLIDKDKVIKAFSYGDEGQKSLERERDVFDRLQRDGSSKYVVRFYEEWAFGLVLERCERTLREELKSLEKGTQPPFALTWARDVCRALAFLHQNGVFHGDLGCQNIMLDQDSNVKLCDFAGSRLKDGDIWQDAWISYEIRCQHPRYRGQQPTLETEIFALGSVLFEIWTCRPPFELESDFVVQQNFKAQVFPLLSVNNLKVREVIENCWKGGYSNVRRVIQELEQILNE